MALVIGLLMPPALAAERLVGRAQVIAGDTIVVDGRDIGGELIEAGLARDCPRFSRGRYADLEPKAARRLPLPGCCTR
jgi:endonuclease YncB( thermonuclease family)